MAIHYVLKCDEKGSLCVVLSAVEGEDEPPVVYKFDRGVSVIEQDPICEWVLAAGALVPLGTTSNLWRKVVFGSAVDRDKGVVFGEYKV